MALSCRSYVFSKPLSKTSFSKMTLIETKSHENTSAPAWAQDVDVDVRNGARTNDHNTPPGRLVPCTPIARTLDAELMSPPPPPSLPPESGGFDPIPAPIPSTALPASFLSINMGFLPSRSRSLKSANGFSSIPTGRSWSPWTM